MSYASRLKFHFEVSLFYRKTQEGRLYTLSFFQQHYVEKYCPKYIIRGESDIHTLL